MCTIESRRNLCRMRFEISSKKLMVGWLVGWMVGLLVGWMVGWLVIWLLLISSDGMMGGLQLVLVLIEKSGLQ